MMATVGEELRSFDAAMFAVSRYLEVSCCDENIEPESHKLATKGKLKIKGCFCTPLNPSSSEGA